MDAQKDFWRTLSYQAEKLFARLSPLLDPSVTIISIRHNETSDGPLVQTEPQNAEITPALFDSVQTLAHELANITSQHYLMDPAYRERDLLRHAIEKLISGCTTMNGKTSLCSQLVPLRGYDVGVILQLNKDACDQFAQLAQPKIDDGTTIPKSLIEAASLEFLRECSDALKLDEPVFNTISRRSNQDILRTAGIYFMYRATAPGAITLGLHGAFEACNAISTMTYEGTDSAGSMIVARRDHPNLAIEYLFLDEIGLIDYRMVRKLLELSKGDRMLLCDGSSIYGVGKVTPPYDATHEDLFIVRFFGGAHWEFVHNSISLMEVRLGIPELPKLPSKLDRFKKTCKRLFGELPPETLSNLNSAMSQLATGGHGTTLIISQNAVDEAQRLRSQCICIKPELIRKPLLEIATRIDGAILIDPNGICHGIGVILDGKVNQKGSRSRGARFNSAVRYVNSGGQGSMAVVVSEDGMINIFPDLMPQIRQSTIEHELNALRTAVAKDQVESRSFNRPMTWFHKHRFYLSQAECEEIDNLITVAAKKWGGPDDPVPYMSFKPDVEMNESFFLESKA